METPWRLLPSAWSGLQPRWPCVVQLHAAGANGPGEPPHQSAPGSGHLHRQATRGGGGRGGLQRGSPRRVGPPWTWLRTRRVSCSLSLLHLSLPSSLHALQWLSVSSWRGTSTTSTGCRWSRWPRGHKPLKDEGDEQDGERREIDELSWFSASKSSQVKDKERSGSRRSSPSVWSQWNKPVLL